MCKKSKGGFGFCYRVEDPENYGVIEFEQKIISITEKPKNPNQTM